VTSGEIVVQVRAPGPFVRLSPAESWQLYVWLGDSAPFVRNRLRVIRQGGSGTVCLSTAEECRHVLRALSEGRRVGDALTAGLLSLESVLDEG
jgi:hypothetical protein